MDNITFNYIDIANKKLKIANSFGCNVYGQCIPKNAIFGKCTNNLYVYVDNFEQFKSNKTRFIIYILDKRKDTRFKRTVISKHTEWYNMIFAYIDYHNLYDVKCQNVLCIKRGNNDVPKLKQSPMTNEYGIGYKQKKLMAWEDTFMTEVDACRKIYYV